MTSNKREILCISLLVLFCTNLLPAAGDGEVNHLRDYRQRHEIRILREFFNLLAVPNVASDRKNIRRNATLISEMMQARGLNVELWETPGSPVIFAERKVDGSGHTLLFYIHYDGQPVDPDQWTDSLPFTPVLRPGKLQAGSLNPKPLPQIPEAGPLNPDWRIYARSASDDKAPIAAILTAMDAIENSPLALRNSIKFILDGEEEEGSPHLRACLESHRRHLQADVLFMCDGPTYFSGDPTLFFGCRGITGLSITVYGADTHLHSGHFGNWAPNPAVALCRLLAGMKTADGRILIRGFYDDMVPLTPLERTAIENIPGFEQQLQDLYSFAGSEGGGKSLMASIQYPSLNINGLSSGWVGASARTIIPAQATASLDIRLVKGNSARNMVAHLIQHIRDRGYHVTRKPPAEEERRRFDRLAFVDWDDTGYPAYKTPLSDPLARKLLDFLQNRLHRRLIVIPSLGGSLPMSMFGDILQVPIIGIPIANHDNNQHQPDENLRLGHLWQAIELFGLILQFENPS